MRLTQLAIWGQNYKYRYIYIYLITLLCILNIHYVHKKKVNLCKKKSGKYEILFQWNILCLKLNLLWDQFDLSIFYSTKYGVFIHCIYSLCLKLNLHCISYLPPRGNYMDFVLIIGVIRSTGKDCASAVSYDETFAGCCRVLHLFVIFAHFVVNCNWELLPNDSPCPTLPSYIRTINVLNESWYNYPRPYLIYYYFIQQLIMSLSPMLNSLWLKYKYIHTN